MKLSFSLKKKEVKLEADVEGIVEKSLDHREKTGPKKPRYQIRQEEKRKKKKQRTSTKTIYHRVIINARRSGSNISDLFNRKLRKLVRKTN